MNAEFLEKNIIISSKTVEGTTTYSTPAVRKNLVPISFIGAVVVTDDGLEANPIKVAQLINTGQSYIIGLSAGHYTLTYTPATGKITVKKGH